MMIVSHSLMRGVIGDFVQVVIPEQRELHGSVGRRDAPRSLQMTPFE
jgi:hypothetical protein